VLPQKSGRQLVDHLSEQAREVPGRWPVKLQWKEHSEFLQCGWLVPVWCTG
ncbi:hypothetical protein A2U01_0114968, partial [Trifolium medium]|nr:hypothetical protein [Trifolium medium]